METCSGFPPLKKWVKKIAFHSNDTSSELTKKIALAILPPNSRILALGGT